jgi:hypothetical protein
MSQRVRWMMGGWLAIIALSGQSYAQQITQVSVGTGGTQPNEVSFDGVFSGDGQSVAFLSGASNLVPSDTNNSGDLFIHDLIGHTTTRLSVASGGGERAGSYGRFLVDTSGGSPNLSLNHDGSVAAFATTASFVANDVDNCTQPGQTTLVSCVDVYVRDRAADQTTLASLASNGAIGNGHSYDPSLSADGRFVVFTSGATTLVTGDTNAVTDVFLRDRVAQTTTRVSVSSTGAELTKASWGGRISGDGNFLVFVTEAAVTSDPDPFPCLVTTQACARAWLVDRGAGTVKRLPIPASVSPVLANGGSVKRVAMTEDGRFIAIHGEGVNDFRSSTFVVVYDRLSAYADVAMLVPYARRSPEVTLSGNGRFVAVSNGFDDNSPRDAVVVDRLTHTTLTQPDVPLDGISVPYGRPVRFSPDGLRVLYNAFTANAGVQVFMFNRDADGDGMPDVFETTFGLNPNDPSDATIDSDGDHVSNLQEYVNGTNPKGTSKRYFAEGAANSFFTTRFGVFNPNPAATTVYLEFLGSNGQTSSMPLQLAANGWTSVTLNDVTIQQPNNDFSTVVESDQPVVIDRTMSWDKTGYGSHAETSIEKPGTTWYLAEGATHGSFDLFYLLQNPGTTPAEVTITYLLPTPAAPIVKHYTVDPKSRKTIHVDEEDPGLALTDVSAKITSDQAILAERAMYFSTPTQAFAAGHEGAAVPAPGKSWFLAEGATGSFFDLFLLIANAETTDADVQVTYLLPSGPPIVKHYDVKAQSRKTINVDFEDPRLIDTPVSTMVESTVDVIAERAMWWPSPNWYEAHLSAGATLPGTKWALADGLVTTTPGTETETFILIANTGTTDGAADVTLFFGDGTTMTKNFTLNANSRTNVRVQAEFPNAIGKGGYGTIIQSNGVPIVVERAMYTNANGQTWAAGTDALATKLQ